MASNQNERLLQCTYCHEKLNFESKTLPCLHSYCRSCFGRAFEGEAGENGHCPKCYEPLTLDKLSLSPFLVKSLRRQQLESADWKCDCPECPEEGIKSTPRNFCHDCQKLHCANCSSLHKKYHPKHNARDLDEMERGEVMKVKMMDMCSWHQKAKDLYCERCNMCFCDTCYKHHSDDYPGCSSQPLPVREEASKQKSQVLALANDMDNLESSLRRLIERTENYTHKLNVECESKCEELWEDFEEMKENAKLKTNKLCEYMRQITDEQVERWRSLLDENEKFLKQVEIWRLNLRHLLEEFQQDVDVVRGLRLLRSKLSHQLHKSEEPEDKCNLRVTFPDWWLQVLENLKSEIIGAVSLTVKKLPAQNLVLDQQWNPCGSNGISSILVSNEDDHVFLCDYNNDSIKEFTECDFVCECNLSDGTNTFSPSDMCSISPDIFLVVASGFENRFIILERKKNPPFLQIKDNIPTKNNFVSLCQINESILACDDFFQVKSITKEGKTIKTIKTEKSCECEFYPQIRADPSSGNFWGTERFFSELFSHDTNGDKLPSVKTKEEIVSFCVNEFGPSYFCNFEGIFSFSTTKDLYIYEEQSESVPRIFVFRNKMFVSLRIDGKDLIKIFKIFY